jgi:hypothetical protein
MAGDYYVGTTALKAYTVAPSSLPESFVSVSFTFEADSVSGNAMHLPDENNLICSGVIGRSISIRRQ